MTGVGIGGCIRLPGYDYTSQGSYFLTLVTFGREPLFGEIGNGEMTLGPLGSILADEWRKSAVIRREIHLDEFVAMPNHLHAIVHIRDVGAHGRAPLRPDTGTHAPVRPPRSIGSLIAGFKSAATKRINEHRGAPGLQAWQRNYYDRIIRNEAELARIRQYIIDNPAHWDADPENPVVATSPASS